jgi:hypothetical protein
MNRTGNRSTPFVFVVSLSLAALMSAAMPLRLRAQEASVAATSAALTWEQMEAFLLEAPIVSSRKIGKGVTDSRVATLSDGHITHDAHIQHVNIEKRSERNFRDHYRYNIAAYRLARLLGLVNVPASVERRVDEAPAAVTWWVDEVAMDEGEREKREKSNTLPAQWRRATAIDYVDVMRVFDELIANADRNAGNQLWTNDGRMWLIDHTRAFRLQHRLKKPASLQRCHRALWQALRALTAESLTTVAGPSLSKDEVNAVIARRDLIVKQLDAMISARGESAVLYTLTP